MSSQLFPSFTCGQSVSFDAYVHVSDPEAFTPTGLSASVCTKDLFVHCL